jgi:F-type H+-transporting ATPase subunit epsilon
MDGKLQLEIVTPFGEAFSNNVETCVVPGANGQFQVLLNHAPIISSVAIGSIKIMNHPDNKIFFATSGGFCEVRDNIIKVIVESAERSDSIDVNRALEAKRRAEERLSSKSEEVDELRAKLALTRAINRIHTAELSS